MNGQPYLPWASTRWLAHEMVRIEVQLRKVRNAGYDEYADMLEAYREFVRDYRSASLRHEPLVDLTRCPACERLITREACDVGERCAWCEASPLEHIDVGA